MVFRMDKSKAEGVSKALSLCTKCPWLPFSAWVMDFSSFIVSSDVSNQADQIIP